MNTYTHPSTTFYWSKPIIFIFCFKYCCLKVIICTQKIALTNKMGLFTAHVTMTPSPCWMLPKRRVKPILISIQSVLHWHEREADTYPHHNTQCFPLKGSHIFCQTTNRLLTSLISAYVTFKSWLHQKSYLLSLLSVSKYCDLVTIGFSKKSCSFGKASKVTSLVGVRGRKGLSIKRT